LAPAYARLKPAEQASSAGTSAVTQLFGSCQAQVCVPFGLHVSLQHFSHTPSVQSHARLPCSASHSGVPTQFEPVYVRLNPSAQPSSGTKLASGWKHVLGAAQVQLYAPSSEMASSRQQFWQKPSVQSHPVLPCSASHAEPAPPAQLTPVYDLLKPSAHSPSGAAPLAEGSPEPRSSAEVGAAVGAELGRSPEPRSLGPPTKTSSPAFAAAFAASLGGPVHSSQSLHRFSQPHLTDQSMLFCV